METESPLVLLVDDDPVVRMITRQTLARAGYTVREAMHGRAAQARLEEAVPALILLDVLMPEMDGFEFCSWLRGQPACARIPVLMMTGLDDNDSIQRAFEVGATDFVVKPVNPSILVQRVRFLLRASQTLEDLARNRESLATAQRIARLGSWNVDFTTQKLTWSEEVFRILEIDSERYRPSYNLYLTRVHPEDREQVRQSFFASRQQGKNYDIAHRLLMPDGREKWVNERGGHVLGADNAPTSASGTIQDITERQRSRDTIRFLSSFDILTSLPNRLLFEQQLERALSHARRGKKMIAVLHIGLNRFKRINESLGHQAGDALLVQVADRLKSASRECDYLAHARETASDPGADANLARWSGDEFVILLNELRVSQDAARAANRLLKGLAEPYIVFGHEVSSTATAGIALFPGDADNAADLLKNADAAMHFAKHNDSGGYGFYTPAINEQARLKLSLEADLRRALERDELLAHYQPKVDRNGRIVGAELLLRWLHPERGLVAPNTFISLAEECGLIVPISEWIIETAAAQLCRWLDDGHRDMGLAVNLSPLHFHHPELLNTVRNAIERHRLPKNSLELELTEGMLMDELDTTLDLLGELKNAGARLAIDDFGTGYSSLSYLTRFPIDVLKIDRSFIRDITTDTSHINITRAIIAMAHGLELEVVAEGVETREQAELLWRESCDLIQGYFYGRPMPAEELTLKLNSRS
jgi:diguanylate cyclase (GGDEF)-like protein